MEIPTSSELERERKSLNEKHGGAEQEKELPTPPTKGCKTHVPLYSFSTHNVLLGFSNRFPQSEKCSKKEITIGNPKILPLTEESLGAHYAGTE